VGVEHALKELLELEKISQGNWTAWLIKITWKNLQDHEQRCIHRAW
jgi:hypothetical protein